MKVTTIIATLLAMQCCVSCKRVPPSAIRPNILLISVDALRADHLGMYGYHRNTSPEIEKWFGNGLVFERAYATDANTTPSVVSFLTGLLPQDHGVRLLYQQVPKNLDLISDRLSDCGYATAAVVSNMVLTTEATRLDRHFHYFDDYVTQKDPFRRVFERDAALTTTAAIKWFDEKQQDDQAFFMWIHYIDPHGPYLPPESKPFDFKHAEEEIIDINRVAKAQRLPDIIDGNEYVDLYDEEIGYVDREIGRLMRYVSNRKLLHNTIVIFTADHGEAMMEHEVWFTHGYHVYEEIIRVPLAIIGPGIAPRRVTKPVSIMDIAPTVLAAGKADISPRERKHALSPMPRRRYVHSEGSSKRGQWRSSIEGSQKWMVAIEPATGRQTERRYYQLEEDPKERRPREWPTRNLSGKRFLELIAADPDKGGFPAKFRWGRRLKAPKVAPGLDDETMERLKALGYVE